MEGMWRQRQRICSSRGRDWSIGISSPVENLRRRRVDWCGRRILIERWKRWRKQVSCLNKDKQEGNHG
jgi:hypothetical protein